MEKRITLTPEYLIAARLAFIKADNERMNARPKGYPRAAWRMENPIPNEIPTVWYVRDTRFKTKPLRVLKFDLNGCPTDLWVWNAKTPSVGPLNRIDLSALDASAKLARYKLEYPY